MHKNQALIGILLTLSGCTATQLRYETSNVAGTVETLTEKQIFYNLSLFEKNEYAVPSQVTVTAGSATAANSVSPTFMTPLGTATVITSQLANTSMSNVANAVATTASNSVAGAVASGTTNMTTNGTSGMTTGTTGGMTTNTTSTAPAGPGTMSAVTTNNSTVAANGTSTSVANGTTGGLTTTTTNGTTGGTTKTGTTGTTNGLTSSTMSTQPNKSLSLALNDNWTEGWTLDPVTDPNVLRRLSALYRYVLGHSIVKPSEYPQLDADGNIVNDAQGNPVQDPIAYRNHVDAQFMCDYPLAPPPTPSGGSAATKMMTTLEQNGTTVTTESGPPDNAAKPASVQLAVTCVARSGKFKREIRKVDRSALKLPGCVICMDDIANQPGGVPGCQEAVQAGENDVICADAAAKVDPGKIFVNKILYVNPDLKFKSITPESQGNVKLGSSGMHTFYGDKRLFHEFELFVSAATAVDSESNGAGSGGSKRTVVPPSATPYVVIQ